MIVQEIEQKNVELISNSRIKEIAKEQNIEGVVVDQIISILYDRGDITYPMKGYVGLIKGKKLAKTEHKQEKFDSYVYPIETVLFGKENNIDYYRNLYNKSIYSDDISQISAALIGLSELGEDIYPYLIGIAKSEKTTPITKEYAIKSLIDLGERAIPFLINLLGNHEDYEVSESIILIILNSIGKIGGEKVIEFIVESSKYGWLEVVEEEEVEEAYFNVLRDLEEENLIVALRIMQIFEVYFNKHEEGYCRRTLNEILDCYSLVDLSRNYNNKDDEIRRGAASLIAYHHLAPVLMLDSDSIDYEFKLIYSWALWDSNDMISDEKEEKREMAVQTLFNMNQQDKSDYFIKALKNESWFIRAISVTYLVKQLDSGEINQVEHLEVVDGFKQLLKDKDYRIRIIVILALWKIGIKMNLNPLEELLETENETHIKSTIERAINYLQSK